MDEGRSGLARTRRRLFVRVGLGAALAVLAVLSSIWAGWKVARSPTYQLIGEIHPRVETARPFVAITFDDGPSRVNTPRILEVLHRHGAKATFFVVGSELAAHREIAMAAMADGHELANHSYSHQRMVLVSPAFVRREIEETDALLRSIGYGGEVLFRPPYAKKLVVLPWVLRELGKTCISWDAEAHDTETQDPDALARNVLRLVHAGSIVLFHDGGPPKPGTVEALDRVLTALGARGLEPVTVSQLLASGR